jgi:diadenosine tetraphosphate (Ap4A) HIT family hydrolase
MNILLTGAHGFLGHHLVDGFNIGWNCGETAGQTVFHAHCHLIPRKADDKNLRSIQYPLLHPWV